MNEKVDKLLGQIMDLTVAESVELASALEAKLGVDIGSLGSAKAPAQSDSVSESTVQDSGLRTVTLQGVGSNKIRIIKFVRELLGLNLIESKRFIDELPQVVRSDISVEEAEQLAGELRELGAECRIE